MQKSWVPTLARHEPGGGPRLESQLSGIGGRRRIEILKHSKGDVYLSNSTREKGVESKVNYDGGLSSMASMTVNPLNRRDVLF